jgi:hypothetical protein
MGTKTEKWIESKDAILFILLSGALTSILWSIILLFGGSLDVGLSLIPFAISAIIVILLWQMKEVGGIVATIYSGILFLLGLIFIGSLVNSYIVQGIQSGYLFLFASFVILSSLIVLCAIKIIHVLWFQRSAKLKKGRSNFELMIKQMANIANAPDKIKLIVGIHLFTIVISLAFAFIYSVFLLSFILMELFFIIISLLIIFLILRRNKFGRYLGIIDAIFGFIGSAFIVASLESFIGLALSIILLYLFFQPDVKEYFE